MRIRDVFSNRFKNYVKYVISTNTHYYDHFEGKKKIVVCLGADYGNLGDVAITFAQMNFLKECFPDYEVIEFPISKTYSDMKSLKEVVTSSDIITIVGGGNTSERYSDIEDCRQFIIEQFKDNPIISFPQSVELLGASEKFVRKMRNAYQKHKKLLYLVREKYSYDCIKRVLPALNCKMCPDIALSLRHIFENVKQPVITISFRGDQERKLDDKNKEEILDILRSLPFEILERDTQIVGNQDFSVLGRKRLLQGHLDAYANSKLVITDRLHGMILAYIANTPCIVFAGDNPKIKGCYEWLKASNSVAFIEDYDKEVFHNTLDYMLELKKIYNTRIDFTELKTYIREFLCE